jgi:hypothetical protein
VSHGPETLQTPEPGMLVLGMKSYGRSSAFLLKIGLQQVPRAHRPQAPRRPARRPARRLTRGGRAQVQDAVTLLKDLAAGAPA